MAIMLYSFRMERGWYYVNAGCDEPFSLRFKVCFIFCHFTGAFILWLKYFVYDLTFKMKEFDMNSTPYKKWLQWFSRTLIECDNQEVPMVMCLHLLWVWLRRNPADLNGAVFSLQLLYHFIHCIDIGWRARQPKRHSTLHKVDRARNDAASAFWERPAEIRGDAGRYLSLDTNWQNRKRARGGTAFSNDDQSTDSRRTVMGNWLLFVV